MSNYVPWHGKKRVGLARVEAKLRRQLATGAEGPGLAKLAEEVRAARVRVLRARLAQVVPCGRDDNDERSRRLHEQIARCAAQPIADLLAEYRRSAPGAGRGGPEPGVDDSP